MQLRVLQTALVLSLAGIVGFSVALPAVWLRWETEAAQADADDAARVASGRAERQLEQFFAQYEHATSAIYAPSADEDQISLTARLLRSEPMVSPALGLTLLDNDGREVASSSASQTLRQQAPWWPAGFATGIRAAIAGCAAGGTKATGWFVERRVSSLDENPKAGWVQSFLPRAMLERMVSPDYPVSPVHYQVRDTRGCTLLESGPYNVVQQAATPIVDLYRRLLPSAWTHPHVSTSSIQVGNLVWTGSVTAAAALNLRAPTTNSRAVLVFGSGAAESWLALLASAVVFFKFLRCDQRINRKTGRQAFAQEFPRDVTVPPLDEADAERDRVLAAIGHDIRTPMNSVLGICAILLDTNLDEPQRKHVHLLRASCQALLAMLNGMLEIAAARLDGAEINFEPVQISSLIEEAGDVLRPQAEDKGLELRVSVGKSLDGRWNTDPTRIRQVLFNICGNAIKYTSRGMVHLSADLIDENQRQLLEIRVVDTGPGIAGDEQALIFQQFRRGRDSVASGGDGLGLGLALCRDIAGLLHGTLSVQSALGKGSTFVFRAPVERVEPISPSSGLGHGRCAAVIGLSDGMRRRVAVSLEGMGFLVETAPDGFVGLGLAERMAFQHSILDLVVIDSALSGMSADALLVRVQSSSHLRYTKTVLIGNEPLAIEMQQRATACLPHPVESRDLESVVSGLYTNAAVLDSTRIENRSLARARILVVDDNHVNQAVFVDRLSRGGFSTFAASNGSEAVEAAERGGFDAILMDVQMPEMDGVEATRRIRIGEISSSRVPIIGLTAHTGPAIRKRCLDAGMDAVLHKPVDLALLPKQLHEAIAAGRTTQVREHEVAWAPASEPCLDIDDDCLRTLVAEVGAKRTSVYLNAFLMDATSHLAALEKLFEECSWAEFGDIAHALAGPAGTLGAATLVDSLLRLEDAARVNDGVQAAVRLKDVFETWNRTRATIRSRFQDILKERAGMGDKAA